MTSALEPTSSALGSCCSACNTLDVTVGFKPMMYFMIRDFVFHWNNFKAFSSLAHVYSLHQWRENEWVAETNLCQILTTVSVSLALSHADLKKTQKLAEDFMSEYRKTPKWGHLSERLDSSPFLSVACINEAFPHPSPFSGSLCILRDRTEHFLNTINITLSWLVFTLLCFISCFVWNDLYHKNTIYLFHRFFFLSFF